MNTAEVNLKEVEDLHSNPTSIIRFFKLIFPKLCQKRGQKKINFEHNFMMYFIFYAIWLRN